MRRRSLSLLALCLLVVACAESAAAPSVPTAVDPPTETDAPAATAEDAERGFTVVLADFAFDPDPIVVPSGPVTLELVNEGEAPHEFAVTDQHSSDAHSHAFDSNEIASGERLTVELDLAPGTYEVACHVQGHFELGMVTTLTVEG